MVAIDFKRYTRELYDRPKASLLPLKARMVRSEVVEALLYGCATWTSLKGHYAKLRTTHHRMLLRILGAWCKSPNKRNPLEQRRPSANRMRNHRNNRAHEKIVVGYPRVSCRESSRTRGNVGRGGRRNNGRTAWQMIFGYLASRGTGASPHLTLESGIAR